MYQILLEVHYRMKPGMRGTFLTEVEPCKVLSAAEDGNEGYDYYLNPEDENDLLLVEKWRDEDILQKHYTMDHFRKLGDIKARYVEETIISKHYVEVK